jgi:hypothetical protein
MCLGDSLHSREPDAKATIASRCEATKRFEDDLLVAWRKPGAVVAYLDSHSLAVDFGPHADSVGAHPIDDVSQNLDVAGSSRTVAALGRHSARDPLAEV